MKPLNQNKMRSYKKELEDEIFDIVTDLIRKDLSKGEAVSKLLILFNVSSLVCDECGDSTTLEEIKYDPIMNTIDLIKDVCLFGGTLPNERINEVRAFLDKAQALQLQ